MFMTPEQYLAEAERYRRGKERATDLFIRLHFETMEKSFTAMAERETARRRVKPMTLMVSLVELGLKAKK